MQILNLPEETEDPDRASRSTGVSVAVNLLLTITRIATGILSKSQGLSADGTLSVETGHGIAVEARNRVMQRHRVLNLMTYVGPGRRAELDCRGRG